MYDTITICLIIIAVGHTVNTLYTFLAVYRDIDSLKRARRGERDFHNREIRQRRERLERERQEQNDYEVMAKIWSDFHEVIKLQSKRLKNGSTE